jgi:hypothetical protein
MAMERHSAQAYEEKPSDFGLFLRRPSIIFAALGLIGRQTENVPSAYVGLVIIS